MRALLIALLGLLCAPALRAEEPPPPPQAVAPAPLGPEEVARLLLSSERSEQLAGEDALRAALRGPPDAAALFARALGDALRARMAPGAPAPVLRVEPPGLAPPAPPPPPAPAAPPGAEPASQQEVAPEPSDPLADPPAAAAPPPAAQPAPTAPPAGPRAKDPPWDMKVWAVNVAAREVAGLLPPTQGAGAPVHLPPGRDGAQAVLGPAEWAPAWAQTALRSADATALVERLLHLWEGEPERAHLGEELRYRRSATRVKGGAWAVETDLVRPGLTLAATARGSALELEVTWVEVARPMATERTRPAPDVEPIELDRPDWSAARRRVSVPLEPQGRAALLVLPGMLPDPERRLVLVVSLLPR